MTIKPMNHFGNRDRWKVFFGPDDSNLTAITVFFKNTKIAMYKKPNPYIVHEPLLLEELAPGQFEYKYFLDGYITRERKFTSYDMAVDSIKSYYKKVLNALIKDSDINPRVLDAEELEYIEKNLPDNNMSKFILKKLKL